MVRIISDTHVFVRAPINYEPDLFRYFDVLKGGALIIYFAYNNV